MRWVLAPTLSLRVSQGQSWTHQSNTACAQGCTQKDPLVQFSLHFVESSSNQIPHCKEEGKYHTLELTSNKSKNNNGGFAHSTSFGIQLQRITKVSMVHGFLLFTLLKEASVLSISYHGNINSLFDAITGQVDKQVPRTRQNAPLKR